jgi:hypothetical protein
MDSNLFPSVRELCDGMRFGSGMVRSTSNWSPVDPRRLEGLEEELVVIAPLLLLLLLLGWLE